MIDALKVAVAAATYEPQTSVFISLNAPQIRALRLDLLDHFAKLTLAFEPDEKQLGAMRTIVSASENLR